MKNLLLVSLACASLLPVARAQTGRIARGSHSGSVLEPVATTKRNDNLGEPAPLHVEWQADTLVYVSDSTAIHKGQYRSWVYSTQKAEAKWHRLVVEELYQNHWYPEWSTVPAAIMARLRGEYPQVTFIGFEKLKAKKPRKPAVRKPASPNRAGRHRPLPHSYWREISTALAVGSVSWLLSKNRSA